uniref:Uncharacterized protein n=1 Tax=Anopheles culicifacies TaxID=139723 RepID=A0A182M588_9DIPT
MLSKKLKLSSGGFPGGRRQQHELIDNPPSFGSDLPERGHGDDRVPERGRNRGKVGAVHVLLRVEHDRGKDDDGHGQGEHQEPKLGSARFERVAQNAQTLRVSRELEDTEDAKHSQRHERTGHIVVVGDAEPDVVRQDRDHVDDAHHAAHELAPARCGKQPQQILGGKDHHARRVQTEEDDFVALAAGQCTGTARPYPARYRLDDVRHHRYSNEEARDVVEHERGSGSMRILEGAPHPLSDVGQLLQVVVTVLRQLVVHQPFGIFPLPVAVVLVAAVPDHVRHDAKECQLLVVAEQTFVPRKKSRSFEPSSVSGYFSTVVRQVSNRRPDTLMMSFSSSERSRSLNTGGAGSGWDAIGTQPMAAARANGNQAATEAILFGGIFQ